VKLLKWPHVTQVEHVAKFQKFLQGYISPATLRLAKSIGYALWLVHAAACTFHYVRFSLVDIRSMSGCLLESAGTYPWLDI